MKLEQIYYLLAVAEKGSINKAAKDLFIAQPNLSSSIKSIEEELQMDIFCRTNRGVILTEQGQKLISSLKIIIEQLEYITSSYKLNNSALRKKQTFSVVHNELFSLVETIHLFKKEYPLYDFFCNIKSLSILNCLDTIHNTSSQCLGILALPAPDYASIMQLIDKRDLIFKPLFKAHTCLIVGQNHPFFNRTSVSLDDVLTCKFVTYAFEELIQTNKLIDIRKKNSSFCTNSKETMLDIVSHTDLASFGSDYLETNFYKKSLGLNYLPIIDQNTDLIFGLVKNNAYTLEPIYDLFIEYLLTDFQKNYHY